MVTEIQDLVLGFNFAFTFEDLIEEILGKTIGLDAIIESKDITNDYQHVEEITNRFIVFK